jgi:DNA-binding MarR family transcriptional regulator
MMIKEEQRKAPQNKDAESQLVLALVKNGLFLQRELGKVCQQFNLNTNQFVVINELMLRGPVSQKELCNRLLFEKSNVSKIVKTLLDKALISITVSPGDRRSTLLIETYKGSETWRNCLRHFNNSSTDMLSILSNEEIQIILRSLKKVGKSLEQLTAK